MAAVTSSGARLGPETAIAPAPYAGSEPAGPFTSNGAPDPLPPPPAPAETWLSRHRGFNIGAQVGVAALALGGCLYVSAVDPNTERGLYPVCPFRAATGLDCPGCGLTRAVRALITGDPVRALDHNLLILVMLPVAVYVYVRWVAASFGWNLPALRAKPWMGWAFAGFVVVYWVVRNLPGPFHWLASGASTG